MSVSSDKKNRTLAGAWRAVAPYVSDAGVVSFTAVALFAMITVILEFFSAGLAASVVAPQTLAVFMVATGALALCGSEQVRRSWISRLAYFFIALALTVFAFWASWYYFSPVPEIRFRLTIAVGVIVGALFAAAGMPLPEDV
jgi:hypothetical protein